VSPFGAGQSGWAERQACCSFGWWSDARYVRAGKIISSGDHDIARATKPNGGWRAAICSAQCAVPPSGYFTCRLDRRAANRANAPEPAGYQAVEAAVAPEMPMDNAKSKRVLPGLLANFVAASEDIRRRMDRSFSQAMGEHRLWAGLAGVPFTPGLTFKNSKMKQLKYIVYLLHFFVNPSKISIKYGLIFLFLTLIPSAEEEYAPLRRLLIF
jgi:hypothetical protein